MALQDREVTCQSIDNTFLFIHDLTIPWMLTGCLSGLYLTWDNSIQNDNHSIQNHSQMKKTRTVPHRKPRYQELKHKGQTRFIKVNNCPATWIETSLDISDVDAIKIFKSHQTRTTEALKRPPIQDINFFR
jgi:hypothetical protein